MGLFQFPVTALVFQFTFSGVTYTCAMASGMSAWVLLSYDVTGTDDVQIQAAITYVQGTKGRVLIMQGTYTITASLTITLSIEIVGMGIGQTLLYLADGVNDYAINVTPGADTYHTLFRDLKIDGNGGAQTNGGCIFANGNTNDGQLVRVMLDRGKENNIKIDQAWGWKITSCLIERGYDKGVNISGSSQFYITDTLFAYQVGIALQTDTGVGATVKGNVFWSNQSYGIYWNRHDTGVISGNVLYNCGVDHANTVDAILVANNADYNTITCNTIDGHSNTRYGISITAGTGNRIYPNIIINCATAPVNDGGTNTKLGKVPIPLIQGTTFVSTAGEAWGWQINADTNFALGIGWLPPEVQQVVRIRVIGVALAAPGAGDYMRIQITGEGATFDEVFTTEPIDVVDHNNEEVNVAIDDVVNWIFDATDDDDIGHLLGGDRLQIKVLHEDAGNGDAETNAIIDTVQLEIV